MFTQAELRTPNLKPGQVTHANAAPTNGISGEGWGRGVSVSLETPSLCIPLVLFRYV